MLVGGRAGEKFITAWATIDGAWPELPNNQQLVDMILVVRNLCNDGLIDTVPFSGRTDLMETIAEQSGIPPIISRMLVY